ncbi:MAG: alpha/beta fold hydrolase [Nitrospinota bacterium]
MPLRAIAQEDHFIQSGPGVRVHLREKYPRGKRRAEAAATVLCLHGQSMPATIAYDLPVPGYSWMDWMAARGMHVFALSVRGYGLSTRPPEMNAPAENVPPAVRGLIAQRDIEAAVRFIRKRLEVKQLNLLGWSWGTTTSATYTANHPSAVRRLAVYAPFYACPDPQASARAEDPKRPGRWNPRNGAWRYVTEAGQRERWDGSIPKGEHAKWREERVVRRWWREQLRYDPAGRKRRPPSVQVPNGAMADAYDRAKGKATYDAADITCPVLLIRGDHDRSSRDEHGAALFGALENSRQKRYVILGDATHFAQYEWCREQLFREVQIFFEG